MVRLRGEAINPLLPHNLEWLVLGCRHRNAPRVLPEGTPAWQRKAGAGGENTADLRGQEEFQKKERETHISISEEGAVWRWEATGEPGIYFTGRGIHGVTGAPKPVRRVGV